MAVESQFDRDSFFAANDFGIIALYKRNSKNHPVLGILDRTYNAIDIGELEFSSTVPMFHLPTASLPDGATVGDTILIDDVLFTVRAIEPDGTGTTRLRLEGDE